MTESIEIYECLDLNLNKYIKFKDTHEGDYRLRNGSIEFTFLLIEIKSEFPPTDCVLHLSYITQTSNTLIDTSIHFMKYRKSFIYENSADPPTTLNLFVIEVLSRFL